MADVGHEVAPDLFESPALRNVFDDGDHPERPPAVVDEPGTHSKCLPGRSVQVERALCRPLLPGVLQELGHRLGGERVTVPVVHEGHGAGIAEGDLSVFVTDDDALGQGVEGTTEPDRIRAGFGDRLSGLARHLL